MGKIEISTYDLVGIPDGVATTLLLIWLSLSLAPWFGGTEIGPLKVPRLTGSATRWLRITGPLVSILLILGYVRSWPPKSTVSADVTAEEYLRHFYDPREPALLKGSLLPGGEIETYHLRTLFGNTKWIGGPHWGNVSFDASGRTGRYANEPGRSPGRVLIQGALPSTVPLIVGEWHQEDGQKGQLTIRIYQRHLLKPEGADTLHLKWGPALSVESEWLRDR